jgi:hypothetical protein
VRGEFRREFRDRTVELGAGEMIVVPRGVEHRPVAEDEVCVLLLERATTVNPRSAEAATQVEDKRFIAGLYRW